MNVKFEFSEEQQKRADAWFEHHWEVVHKGFRPRDMSGFAVWYHFGPTGMGCNVKMECVWCPEGHQGHEIDLTEDSDEGGFIFDYDENWNRIPAPWEKKNG